MQSGEIVKIFDHGNQVQILCLDDRGLLSIFLEHKQFYSLLRVIKRTGLKVNGLLIKFDKDVNKVPALGNNRYYFTRKYKNKEQKAS